VFWLVLVETGVDLGLLSPAQLRRLVEALRAENEALRAENADLRVRIEELERRVGSYVAPFSRNRPNRSKKKPGRKAGEGVFSRRGPPTTDGPVEDAPVSVTSCPDCGGELEPDGYETVSTTDLPQELPALVVKRVRLEICRCRACGRKVRATHPDVAPGQHGATAHRLGERLKGASLALHYGLGLPLRKVPKVIGMLTGIEVTQGALTQCAQKLSESAAGQAYKALVRGMPQAPVIYTDDTGWRTGGKPAWLMGFQTDEATVFQILARHRNEEVRRIVPGNYAGILSTDRGTSYDAKALGAVRQNKCCAHIRRSIKKAMEHQKPACRTVGINILGVIDDAMALWKDFKNGKVTPDIYASQSARLKHELARLLQPRKLRNRANQTLIDELGWHERRGSLLLFLDDPRVEPTNNRAERILRSAVIARKVSHCSRNERGATTYATIKSITVTASQQMIQPHKAIAALFRGINPFLTRAPTPAR
jgi:transposase